MKKEKLGCFGQTWNIVWIVILALSILFALWAFSLSSDAYVLRLAAFFATVTSIAGTVYQVYKKGPDGFLNAVKHEFFITRKSISGTAIWIVNRTREIVDEATQKQTDDIKSHIDKKHENTVPDSLLSASRAVKNAYLALDSVDIHHRQTAILTLQESDDSKAIEALRLTIEQHRTPSIRMDAALALAEKTQGKNQYALPGLFEALDSQESEIKKRALASIWQTFQNIPSLVSPTEIRKLIAVLGDADDEVAWSATQVLMSQSKITLPDLLNAISHDFFSVRIAALQAIWLITRDQSLPRQQLLRGVSTLIEALEDYTPGRPPKEREFTSVSKLAEKILVRLSPVEELSAYLQNDRKWLHKHVKHILERIQSKNTEDDLVTESENIQPKVELDEREVRALLVPKLQYVSDVDESVKNITREDLLIIIEQTRNMMIDYANEQGYSASKQWKAEQESNYSINRKIILSLQDDQILELIPHSLKTHATLSSVRSIVKAEYSTYTQRTEYIRRIFTPLIDYLQAP